MGWRPSDVRDCTLADFEDAFDGYIATLGGDPGPDMSDAAVADLDALMEQYPDTVH